MNDPVSNPRHYTQGKIECLDAIESMSGVEDFCGYLRASIVKYLWRAKSKGKVLEDVRKAQFYMNKLVVSLEEATKAAFTAPVDPEPTPVREPRKAVRKPKAKPAQKKRK